MLVEHAFVTTRNPAEVLSALTNLLTRMGFAVQRTDAAIEATRGRKNSAASVRISRLPMRVHLSYDRGRVALAASVETPGKELPEHEALLFTLSNCLERATLGTQPDETLLVDWTECLRTVDKHGRAGRGLVIGCLTIFILAIVGGVIAAIISN